MIKEFRNVLNFVGKYDVKIVIVVGVLKDKMYVSDLKGFVDNGVDIIYLMMYDFFGNEWVEEFNYYLNLYFGGDWFVDIFVFYMIDEFGIDFKNIYIGYVNYLCNVVYVEVISFFLLWGFFEKLMYLDSNGILMFVDG